jgi:hypothetical protein
MHSILRNCLLAAVVLALSAAGQSTDDETKLEGNWRGESNCTIAKSACHDESVVYHIAKLAGRPGSVSVSADKIVNGEPVAMGTLQFQYDRTNRTLTCEYSQGVWRFKVDGLTMEGTLTLRDKTVFRHVKLKKEE